MPFFCKNNLRRLLVGAKKDSAENHININGIDFLEVSPDQKNLEIHFFHNLPGQTDPVPAAGIPLNAENFIIEGGLRIKNVIVTDYKTNEEVITITLNQPGDFSTYTLRLVTSSSDKKPPANFDPQLSFIDFSFKVNCFNEFDCRTEESCPPQSISEPRIDYLAKDYASFRRIMLDRLSHLMPDWQERNIADLQIALVELLAYTGDHLSYYQDAVATEAYLFTARKRTSLRRHARLLDYRAHDGCNARAWVHIAVEAGGVADGAELKAEEKKIKFLTRSFRDQEKVETEDSFKNLNLDDVMVFEPMHDITLHSKQNEIHFYTWGSEECCLSKGSTKAVLYKKGEDAANIYLKSGDVLILEEVLSPSNGKKQDADPNHRHAIRLRKEPVKIEDIVTGESCVEIEWEEADALPFPLWISKKIGNSLLENISIARGNIVLADHGLTLENQSLNPGQAPKAGKYSPKLQHHGVSVVEHKGKAELSELLRKPASMTLKQNPKMATPAIELIDGIEKWLPQRDLLSSDRFAREFVTEISADASVQIRFGDDTLSKKPGQGFTPKAKYRLGNDQSGNVGAESIGRMVWSGGGILDIRNPMAAQGGTNAETMEEIRQFAPEAFRTQERAVSETDYVAKTELHPQVQKSIASFRWTGSWFTVFITIDRKNGLPIDNEFKQEITRHLEKYRMAVYDLEIRQPIFVPLEIVLKICVKKGFFKSKVKENLLLLFSRYDLPNGTRGFFHPDEFTFGQALYLSRIYQKVKQVEGIHSVETEIFKRWRQKENQEKENGVILPASNEILQLDNDPNFPENGRLSFIMMGGL